MPSTQGNGKGLHQDPVGQLARGSNHSALARWGRPVALSIAGSDSGGGAGIQADLKTFQALGVYGASAITAITAQNTLGVRAVHEVPVDLVRAQIDAVVEDFGVDTAKTGMLSSSEIIAAVADRVKYWGLQETLVVDPVMIAKSGARLLHEDAIHALVHELLPLAAVLTPNLREVEVLVGRPIHTDEDLLQAARDIVCLGPRAVVMKGGHRSGDPVDLLFDGREFHTFAASRVNTRSTHGTGCTFSAAVAAHLALGASVVEAIRAAKEYLTVAILRAAPLGGGYGPVAHEWPFADSARRGSTIPQGV
jgi:hydroxymethylpyrimidine/phosphomethylpyrimidine kinase